MRARRLQSGEVFADRYEVQGLLGRGAMGTVHRVLDRKTGEARALKVMSLELLGTAEFAERFQREARISGSLESDNIVRVHDSGVDEATSFPYLTMDLLEGEDLHRRLEREPDLPPEEARALLGQVFAAMAEAHEANIIHRDLKPENLFVVTRPGRPPQLKVLDFGVAKVFREVTAARTRAGLGSPLWVAPEQGKEGQAIRPSSDVWALGLIAYRLLAGQLYWRAASAKGASAFDLAVEMLRAPIVAPSIRSRELGARDLGPAFDAWFLKALDRDPSARFQSAGEAFEALRPILDGEAPSTCPPSLAQSGAPGAPARAGRDSFARSVIRFLTFRASAEELRNLDQRHLVFGLVATWLVGIGRTWDDPTVELARRTGVGSVAYVFALSLALWLVARPLRMADAPRLGYRQFLTFVALTAPPAALYAIPVERFVSMDVAIELNLAFLAIVAAWRVGLLLLYLARAAALRWYAVAAAALLPLASIVTVLTFLRLSEGVIRIMGGLRERTPEDGVNGALVGLTLLSYAAAVPLLALYLVLALLAWRDRRRAAEEAPTGR